jgi:hypothetical protein
MGQCNWRRVLIAAAMMWPTAALASHWKTLGAKKDGIEISIDIDSIIREGDARRVIVRKDYAHVRRHAEHKEFSTWRINCLTQDISVPSITTYAPDGTILSSVRAGALQPIAPYSIGERVFDIVCVDAPDAAL